MNITNDFINHVDMNVVQSTMSILTTDKNSDKFLSAYESLDECHKFFTMLAILFNVADVTVPHIKSALNEKSDDLIAIKKWNTSGESEFRNKVYSVVELN